MQVSIIDRMTFGDRSTTTDGYLATVGKIARSGMYEYAGSELGRPEIPVVKVYRDEAEVFAEDAVRSFAYKPLTDGHPPVSVTSKNWRDYSRGQLGGKAMRDGDTLDFPMVIMDQGLIDKINAGKVELSAGYSAEITFEDGETPGGEKYQAKMSDIRGNHVAVVPKGRAGNSCRLGDAWPTEIEDKTPPTPKKETPKVSKIVYDGLQVDLTDAEATQALIKKLTDKADTAVAAVETANKALTDAQAATATAATEHATAIQAKDAELATVKAENETLKTQVADASSPEKLKAAAAAYTKVVDTAKALGAEIADGATEADIKKSVVSAKLGDVSKEWTDAQIDVSFNTLAAGVKSTEVTDTFRSTFTAPVVNFSDGDPRKGAFDARKAMIEDMQNGNKADAK